MFYRKVREKWQCRSSDASSSGATRAVETGIREEKGKGQTRPRATKTEGERQKGNGEKTNTERRETQMTTECLESIIYNYFNLQ